MTRLGLDKKHSMWQDNLELVLGVETRFAFATTKTYYFKYFWLLKTCKIFFVENRSL